MKSHFFALAARMKFIRRWGLMHNTQEENIQEHAVQTAMIAYHLAVLGNTYFGGHWDPKQAAVLALYHDAAEIFTGDMPTPVKYFNDRMRRTYGEVEDMAKEQLLRTLPDDLQEVYRPIVCHAEADPVWPLVKAADTLSAYIKCVQELAAGNKEFSEAFAALEERLKGMNLREVDKFLEDYVPSFRLSIDELNKQ